MPTRINEISAIAMPTIIMSHITLFTISIFFVPDRASRVNTMFSAEPTRKETNGVINASPTLMID